MVSVKIGIVIIGDKSGGGILQYTQSLLDAIKEDNSRQYVLFLFNKDLETYFEHYGFEIRILEKPSTNYFQKSVRFCQLLFLIRKPYFFNKNERDSFADIDLFYSSAIIVYPHFYIGKPFVFTLHDMQERYFPDFFSRKERFMRWINNRVLSKSSVSIICESEYVKSDIVRFTNVSRDKIHIIQSPPPIEFYNFRYDKTKRVEIKAKYDLPEKYILYPAQCWPHKNHINLIEAFKIVSEQHNDISLIFTGSQQHNYDKIMSHVNRIGLTDKIKHLGYIDYEDLPYLYKLSEMLVMPSLFESISIPIYEAFSLGVPVCCSNVVALPDQVGDAAVIFDPNSKIDMAEKILMFLNTKTLVKEKTRKGYEKIANFNHQAYNNKLLKVLNL